ncbi:MAG: SMC-Scp complex subunit ScpB [Planctomycetota bacterium]|nr:SMC-Scp complex subunit ScpB [Planctomycetota bacterium]
MNEPEKKPDDQDVPEIAEARDAGAPPDAEAPGAKASANEGEGGDLDLSRSVLAGQAGAAVVEPEGAEAAETEEGPDEAPVDLEQLGRTLEALLFSADHPLTVREMGRAAGVKTGSVRKSLKLLGERYEAEARAWMLAEVSGGYQLVTRPEYHPAIQRLRASRSHRKLTQAAIETLAFIAYSKEPVGRAEIESVRGVESGAVLRQLLERKLVRIAGRGTGLGQPLLYSVSSEFLEYFGLKSAEELPRSGELKGA